MLRHLLTIAIRNIRKHWKYSLIKILGLSIGIASFLFIMIYVKDELSYDRFHENYKTIYRVNRLYDSNDIHEDAATCSFPFGPALAEAYPDMVKNVVRFFDFQVSEMLLEYRKDSTESVKFNERWFYLADSTVFDMFTFPLLEGDPLTVLDEPNKVVLSESTARRYFGDEPAIGKVLILEEQIPLEISGIMADLPSQSHFRIDILGSMSTYRQLFGGQMPNTWIWNPCWTYVDLYDQIDPEQLEAQLPRFYLNHYADFQDQEIHLYLQALNDIHLQSDHDYEMHPNGKLSYIRILIIIALSVLLLACINFINLATASSSGRAREIGMKKAVGARSGQLRVQFLGESLLVSLMALLLAAILVELLLPSFNNFTGKSFNPHLIWEPQNILAAILLLLMTGFISGFYPAIYLSRLKAPQLKASLSPGSGKGVARKLLVVVQFLISVALIIGTISAWKQLLFLRNADLGFNRDQIILLPTKFQMGMHFESFSQELKKHPQILSVTGMEDIIGVNHNTRSFVIEGMFDDQAFWYPAFMVRYDFIETFNIQVVEGRAFSRDFPSDTADAIMINESMVRHLGWTNEEAIGKAIRSDGEERVIGIFSDFNALSLHKPVDNFILDMIQNPRGAAALTRYMAIRVNTNDYQGVLDFMEMKWNDFAPTRPFEYSFLDDELNALYKDEHRFSRLAVILTILAITIACLGVIGLTSFMLERKTKEISIRRVHGASLSHVNILLSKEFILLVLIANLLSWPLAWLGIHHWLQSFSRHIEIHWHIFLASALLTTLLTLIITSLYAYRAVRINPSESLKYE